MSMNSNCAKLSLTKEALQTILHLSDLSIRIQRVAYDPKTDTINLEVTGNKIPSSSTIDNTTLRLEYDVRDGIDNRKYYRVSGINLKVDL